MWELILFFIAVLLIIMRKMDIPLLIILGFFNAYTFTASNVSKFLFVHNYADTALVLLSFMTLVLVMTRRPAQIKQLKPIKWGVILFFLFYIAIALVDLTINKGRIVDVIKLFRIALPIASVWLVSYFRTSEIKRLIKYIVIVSIILSVILIFQHYTGIKLLKVHLVRFSNRSAIPWIASLFVFLLLMNDYIRNPYLKWGIIGCILFNLILSGSRSLTIAYAIAMLAYYLLYGKFSVRRVIPIVMFLGGVVLTLSTDNTFSKRMQDAANERQNIEAGDVSGTFSMRILLLYERMDYINEKPQRMVFGIGSIQDKDFPRNFFKIGLKLTWNASPQQLDTGDIAWAPLFLRFGYVGTAIFVIFFYFQLIKIFWMRRKNKLFFSAAVYLLLNLIFISFTYSYIYEGHFFLLPLLLCVFIPAYDDARAGEMRLFREQCKQLLAEQNHE